MASSASAFSTSSLPSIWGTDGPNSSSISSLPLEVMPPVRSKMPVCPVPIRATNARSKLYGEVLLRTCPEAATLGYISLQ